MKYTFLKAIAVATALTLQNADVQAQCPINNACTPGNATDPNAGFFGGGIFQVKIGTTFTNTTVGQADGYKDYCSLGPISIPLGSPTAFTAKTGNTFNENLRVFVDLNNDETFTSPGELVFSSTGKTHAGNITLGTGVTGQRLKMRITSDQIQSAVLPGPCTTPEFSQVEDYVIIITQNTNPPKARFSVSDSITCNGNIAFTDLSTNNPTAWLWSFGDGLFSTDKNPNHTYSGSGSYSVKLKVTNANGSDSLTKTNFIQYNDTIPGATSCQPITFNQCCGYGISSVVFGTINNPSGLGTYEDFTCSKRTTILKGKSYPIQIGTNPNQDQDTKIWIDYNGNNTFESNELVYTSIASRNPTGSILISSDTSVKLNRGLRMRVLSEFTGATTGPCTDLDKGQCEDYTVVIKDNVEPPIASFTVFSQNFCLPNFTFTSTSQNSILSYHWFFGDGTDSIITSSVISHTYPSPGSYSVKLVAIGPFGTDTINQIGIVNYLGAPVAACALTTQVGGPNFNPGIAEVKFGSIFNRTGPATQGYQDYSCTKQTTVTVGQSVALTVRNSGTRQEKVQAWIDWNGNGTYETSERVMNTTNDTVHIANVIIPGNAILGSTLRLRVASNLVQGGSQLVSCGTIQQGQAEDYGIVVLANTSKPKAAFGVNNGISCSGVVQFSDSSQNLPTQYLWSFGDGQTSTQASPAHTYATIGTFSVKLKTSNAFGSDSITKVNFVNITGLSGLLPTTCIPAPNQTNAQFGIGRVVFAGIDKTSGNATEGNKDFTCESSVGAGVLGNSLPIQIINSGQNNQNVGVWIDYNNDGTFSNNESVFTSNNAATHNGNVLIPASAVTGVGLRIRVKADASGQTLTGPCVSGVIGQYEDYQIVLQGNNQKPKTFFKADNVVTCNGLVSFSDTSFNGPTSWKWHFGDGDSSDLRNPVHQYNGIGNYSIRLITSNSFGSDTLFKLNYVTVQDGDNLKAAPCTPLTVTTTNNPGVGITRVTFNTILRVSPTAPTENYVDASCQNRTTVIQGQSYQLTVATNQNFGESCRAWIDWNNNGQFEDLTERVLNGTNNSQHTISVLVPSLAKLDTVLRLRIISDAGGGPGGVNIQPCTGPNLGQCEDYGVKVIQNLSKPTAKISNSFITACNPNIQFRDSSLFVPTSWLWSFGDGNTSTSKDPVHVYQAIGTYTVKLKVANAFGSDSVTIPNYVNITGLNGPKPASCNNPVLTPSANLGITRVRVGSSFDKTTGLSLADGGSKDFSCSDTMLIVGSTGPQNITVNTSTGNFRENCQMYIDFNNDGIFANPGERILNTNNNNVHTINRTFAQSECLGVPVRMRVISDLRNFQINGPCYTPQQGQAEDYTIRLIWQLVTTKPIAKISNASINSCNLSIQFKDSSSQIPSSWKWYFGDGNSSTDQNPIHVYQSVGNYTVKLVVGNVFGYDSVTIPNYVNITGINGPKLSSCTNPVIAPSATAGITRVRVGTIFDKTTGLSLADGGSKDFSCTDSMVVIGSLGAQNITINTSTGNVTENCQVYIDFNNDGIFSFQTERILNTNNNNVHTINRTFTQAECLGVPVRMRVISDLRNFQINGPCYTPQQGQAEDYSIRLIWELATTKPIAKISNTIINSCNLSIAFKDSSSKVPTAWKWYFGDGNSSTEKNPVHVYQATGTYTVKLVVSNGFGSDSVTVPNYVTITGTNGPKLASCTNPVIAPSTTLGITRVRVGTSFDKTTGLSFADGGSKDFACTTDTIYLVGNSGSQNFTINTSSGNFRENCHIYIDLNNDGVFSNFGERILNGFNNNVHTTNRTFTQTECLGIPVRMRVISDNVNTQINGPCYSPQQGQAEDYSIRLVWVVSNEVKISGTDFNIFPNPGAGIFTAEGSENIKSAVVTDIQGRILVKEFAKKDLADKHFDLSQLPNGIYNLHILSEKGPVRKQIVIQK